MLLIEFWRSSIRRAFLRGMAERQRATSRLRCESLEDRTVPSFLPPVTSHGEFGGVGDFNGDGQADLAVTDYNAHTVSVRLGNGDGTFQPAGPAQSVQYPSGAAVADFDGDGKFDVLTRSYQLNVLRGNGDGTLQAPVVTGLSGIITTILVADMNNDGRSDAVVRWFKFSPIYAHYDYWLSILPSQTDGSFIVTQSLYVGFSHTDHGQTTKQLPPWSVHLADFDGDGRRDLMTVAANSSNDAYPSKLFWGNGDGTVTSGPNVNQFVGVTVTTGDVNRDRKADVIRKNIGGSTFAVFLGEGNGDFTKTQNVAIAAVPVIADINRDRKPDLVAVNPADGKVRVLLGNGDGKFKAAQDFAAGLMPTAIAVGDFDGDGWLDVIAASGGTLSVLLNDRSW